jgi:uncharacterized protein DUF1990
MSQNIGGHSPTNNARRSALPRADWSTVLARIHSPMHSPIDPSDAARSDIEAGVLQRATIAFISGGYPPRVDLRGLGIVARWPLGIALVSWRYLWRVVVVHRADQEGDGGDLPEPVPVEHQDDRLVRVEDGVGPMLHRRYRVVADGGSARACDLIAAFGGDPNRGAPADVAVFLKTRGHPDALRLGDEFVVRMPGPWDGPVRVVNATPTSIRLATLRGHLEAGQIEFRARDLDGAGGGVEIEIESWARAADRLSHVLYNRLRLAKEIQLNLWLETCLQLAALGGGHLRDGVYVDTRRVADPGLLRTR